MTTTHITQPDVPAKWRSSSTTGEHTFGGVDLAAIMCDEIAGIIVRRQDVPDVIDRTPVSGGDDSYPPLYTHTPDHPSKFDLRDPGDGRVVTQVWFGSLLGDRTLLDLRPNATTPFFEV